MAVDRDRTNTDRGRFSVPARAVVGRVGVRSRIAGLSLRATDTEWTTGTGPEVRGPIVPQAALERLTGDGVAVLRDRD